MNRLKNTPTAETMPPPSDPSNPDIEKGRVPPPSGASEFYKEIEAIKRSIGDFEGVINDIAKMHDMALHSVDLVESKQLATGIEEKTSENNHQGQQIAARLKEMTEQATRDAATSANPNAIRMRHNIINSISAKFAEKIKAFQKLQVDAKKRYTEQLQRQYTIVKAKATPAELEEISSEEGGAVISQQLFDNATRADSKKVLEKMMSRQKSIQKLEKSLLGLHQLFLDMQLLIQMQGKVINRIEDNVNEVKEYTEVAAKEMDAAVVYQKAAWKKRMWFFLIGGGFLLFFVIVVLFPIISPLIGRLLGK